MVDGIVQWITIPSIPGHHKVIDGSGMDCRATVRVLGAALRRHAERQLQIVLGKEEAIYAGRDSRDMHITYWPCLG